MPEMLTAVNSTSGEPMEEVTENLTLSDSSSTFLIRLKKLSATVKFFTDLVFLPFSTRKPLACREKSPDWVLAPACRPSRLVTYRPLPRRSSRASSLSSPAARYRPLGPMFLASRALPVVSLPLSLAYIGL